MNPLQPLRCAACVAFAALFAACAADLNPSALQSNAQPTLAEKDHSKPWMLPGAKNIKRLLYLAYGGIYVYVYDYARLRRVGTLTLSGGGAGECVDAKGDVWILEDTNGSSGGGVAVEYAHGGTTQLNQVTTNQPPGSCSVSPNGDLEITDGGILSQSGELGPGEIQIWKGGSGKPIDYAATSACYRLTSAGYDNKGNLYVTAATESDESAGICELRAGGKTLSAVSVNQQVTDPLGIMWDGKYMAITDVYYGSGSNYATEILAAKEGNGGVLKIVGTTKLADSCEGNEVYVMPPPFIVGKKNTPLNTQQGTAILGFNFICGINPSYFRIWAYPAGGSPLEGINVPDIGGEVVSIGT